MEMKNVIVAQSGGPTSAINASLSGVLKAIIDSPNYDRCYGAVNGILGVLSEMKIIKKIAKIFRQIVNKN